jgi:hypothetical protein
MYWRLSEVAAVEPGPAAAEGRYVVHRHRDADGAHLDLRLEQGAFLLGWRVDGAELATGVWAMEKGPHPVHWLEQDGDAVREDEGVFAWVARDASGGELELRGRACVRRIRLERVAGLSAGCICALRETMIACAVTEEALAGLASDGAIARRRALERFCGLGRELDGDAFDEGMWRATLAGQTLASINRHLEAMEVRFDRKYPPLPVSQPERLEEDEGAPGRTERVLAILRG